MHELGYNYRITDIQCALGLSQMKQLNKFVSRRRKIWTHYNNKLEGIEGFQTPIERKNAHSAWHLYAAQANERDGLLEFLHDNGIGAHVMYIPVHRQPYYQKYFNCQKGDFPFAEAYFDKSIILPLYPSLKDTQVEHIAAQIKKFYQY